MLKLPQLPRCCLHCCCCCAAAAFAGAAVVVGAAFFAGVATFAGAAACVRPVSFAANLLALVLVLPLCPKPPRYVSYKGTYVPYDGTYGMPDQGQTLDVQEGQTAELALRDDWTWNVPHHTLEVVLEVILECTGLRP